MGGPIVRTGTTPAFWKNWEKAFGKGKKSKSADGEAAPAKKPAAAKSAKKSTAAHKKSIKAAKGKK